MANHRKMREFKKWSEHMCICLRCHNVFMGARNSTECTPCKEASITEALRRSLIEDERRRSLERRET